MVATSESKMAHQKAACWDNLKAVRWEMLSADATVSRMAEQMDEQTDETAVDD
jgi:hypothetical protein